MRVVSRLAFDVVQRLGHRASSASGRPLAFRLVDEGRGFATKASQKRSSRDLGLYLLSMVVGMVGVTYASVPLYRIFCNATGFAGTVQTGKTVEEKIKVICLVMRCCPASHSLM